MKRAFLSFALCAVFLLSLSQMAANAQGAKADLSYQKFRAAYVFEVAAKRAFYRSIGQSAAAAYATAIAAKADPRAAVQAASFSSALLFESSFPSDGGSILIWCGNPSEPDLEAASDAMLLQRAAKNPQGTAPLVGCADSFDADTLEREVRLQGLGISFYHEKLGLAYAASFPESYAVKFYDERLAVA